MKQILLSVALLSLAGFALAQNSGDIAQPPPGQAVTRFAPNTVIPVELSKSLDAKKVKVGQPFEAKSTMDMLSEGKVILPRETKIIGHVTSVNAHSKESPDSSIGIAFDHAVMKDGHELPLSAAVQAIGPPMPNPMAISEGVPMGGGAGMSPGMGAGGAPMGGGGSMAGGPAGGAGSAQPSYPSGSVPSMPQGSPGRSTGALSPGSQGVVGLKGVELKNSGQESVISCSKKNVHLDGGTQMILRVQ